MRTMIAIVVTATLAAPPAAGQALKRPPKPPTQAPLPMPPPTSVHPECYRPDVRQNKVLIQQALATKTDVDPKDQAAARNRTAGCTFYKITLSSTVKIDDTEVPGVSSTITGRGTITLGLAPDEGEAGYDFTSGVDDLTAPIIWKRGSALITKPDCIVTTVELPYTMFGFWLGVTNSPTMRVGVRITPDGNEDHDLATRCKDPMGRWHDGTPGEKQAIFTPAWIFLHGEGKNVVAPTADQQAITKFQDDVVKGAPKDGKVRPNRASTMPAAPNLSGGGLDVAKIQAYMAKHPGATPAEMMAMMNGVVPGLDQQLAAAEDNFMFTAPGDCAPTNAVTVVCTLGGTPVTMKSRVGFGTIKTITESTVITIEKVSPPAGAQ